MFIFQIGHSLISLKIAHGFSGTALPAEPLRHLTSLQELDMSNNKIQSMSDTSFHFLKNLRLLELHDNRIEQVMKGTFQVSRNATTSRTLVCFSRENFSFSG